MSSSDDRRSKLPRRGGGSSVTDGSSRQEVHSSDLDDHGRGLLQSSKDHSPPLPLEPPPTIRSILKPLGLTPYYLPDYLERLNRGGEGSKRGGGISSTSDLPEGLREACRRIAEESDRRAETETETAKTKTKSADEKRAGRGRRRGRGRNRGKKRGGRRRGEGRFPRQGDDEQSGGAAAAVAGSTKLRGPRKESAGKDGGVANGGENVDDGEEEDRLLWDKLARMVISPFSSKHSFFCRDVRRGEPSSRSRFSSSSSSSALGSRTLSLSSSSSSGGAEGGAQQETSTARDSRKRKRNVYTNPLISGPSTTSGSGRCREATPDLVDGVIADLVHRRERLKKNDPWRKKTARRTASGGDSSSMGSNVPGEDGVNVLSRGYALGSGGGYGPAGCSAPGVGTMPRGVRCATPNTTASYVRSSPLTAALHRLLGDERMRGALLHAIVAVPAGDTAELLGRGNYLQLCGPPLDRLNYLGKKKGGSSSGGRPLLRRSASSRGDGPEGGGSSAVTSDDASKAACEESKRNRKGPQGLATEPPSKRRKGADGLQTGDDDDSGDRGIEMASIATTKDAAARRDGTDAAPGTGAEKQQSSAKSSSPGWDANAPLPRHRIFYADSYVPKVGLPHSHELNRRSDSPRNGGNGRNNKAKTPAPDPEDAALLDAMVQLYCAGDAKRDGDGKAASGGGGRKRRKRWKRLRSSGALGVCRELRRRHGACDYARLLERHCPLPDALVATRDSRQAGRKKAAVPAKFGANQAGSDDGAATTMDDGACADSTSAASSSAPATDAATTSVADPQHDAPPAPPSPSLQNLAAAHTPSDDVAAFLRAALRRAFPGSFWGSERNFQTVAGGVGDFVRLRRWEQFPEKDMMRGVRVTDVAWLYGDNNPGAMEGKGGRDTPENAKSTKETKQQRHNGTKRSKGKTSRTDHEAATVLVRNVLRWVYRRYITPLLRSTFYVTEGQFAANRVLYYRKPAWARLRSVALSGPLAAQFVRLDNAEARRRLAAQAMGCARLRLLPKSTGIRAIASLSRRQRVEFFEEAPSPRGGVGVGDAEPEMAASGASATLRAAVRRYPPMEARFLSTNAVLRRVFDVLGYEHRRSPGGFGAGVLGTNEVFPRLRAFLDDLRRCRGHHGQACVTASRKGATGGVALPKLYFVSADIQHCYDNIDQAYLYGLVKKLFSENDYLIQKSTVLHPFDSMGKVQGKATRMVGPPEGFATFPTCAGGALSQKYSQSLFVDSAHCSVAKRDELLQLLREHIFSHVVATKGRRGPKFLVQSNGIPQGSVLSTILCNYYYGDLEGELLDGVFRPPPGGGSSLSPLNQRPRLRHAHLLTRIVDDFLLITTDRDAAVRFLDKMNAGIPKLGVTVNRAKTRTSFDMTVAGNAAKALQFDSDGRGFFAWCGMLFDTLSCEVRIDYSRFSGSLAKDALTVIRSGSEGSHLLTRMKSFVRPRCQRILYDTHVNGSKAVAFNFYQAMLLCATKTVHYVDGLEGAVCRNPAFIVSCMDEVIAYAYNLIISRLGSAGRDTADKSPKMAINMKSFLWMGAHAFLTILQRDPSKHGSLLDIIARNQRRRGSFLPENSFLHQVSHNAAINFDLSSVSLVACNGAVS